MPLAGELAAAGLPVPMVNPRHVRDFAEALGKLAKSDTLDARILAHFAEATLSSPSSSPSLKGGIFPGQEYFI